VIIADFDAIFSKTPLFVFGFSIDQTLAPVNELLFPSLPSFIAFQLIAVLALDENRTIFWVNSMINFNFATLLCSISIVSFPE
jgi:hypothetical protein